MPSVHGQFPGDCTGVPARSARNLGEVSRASLQAEEGFGEPAARGELPDTGKKTSRSAGDAMLLVRGQQHPAAPRHAADQVAGLQSESCSFIIQ